MGIRIERALFHPHYFEEKDQFLTDIEFFISNDKEDIGDIEKYLIRIINYNSKKNSGKLARFNKNPKMKNHINTIFKDNSKFVVYTRRIMTELIYKYTFGFATKNWTHS